jgi:hypothetical protein
MADYWPVDKLHFYRKDEFLCEKCWEIDELRSYAIVEMGVQHAAG